MTRRVLPDRTAYFKSLADELAAQAQRVRHLIGDSHWLSDGHHKEYLLSTLLGRHLPAGVLLSRGFVVDPHNSAAISHEQDLLLVDATTEGCLFDQGGLIVALARSVLATISVKSRLTKPTLLEAAANLRSAAVLASGVEPNDHLLTAAYFFESDPTVAKSPKFVYSYLDEANAGATPAYVPDVLASGGDLLFRLVRPVAPVGARQEVAGYTCPGTATGLLVARLVDHITATRTGVQSELLDMMDHCDSMAIPREG
jgi:hypothetical protein